jgi:hypothetical protein
MAKIVGLRDLSKFSGYGINTLSTWRKNPPSNGDPIPFGDIDKNCVADSDEFRAWLIRNGRTKVQQPESREEIEAANKAKREAKQPGRKAFKPSPRARSEPSDELDYEPSSSGLESLIDPEIYASFPVPTGDIEDEISHARQLRHKFGALVASWRMSSLTDPKTARTFRDFAAELVRQIAVIGKLEGDLTKQRMRVGRLLDEQSVMTAMERLAAGVCDLFADVASSVTEMAVMEVARIATEKSVDLSLDGDRFRKMTIKILDDARQKHGDSAPEIVRGVQVEQGERMGADEDAL